MTIPPSPRHPPLSKAEVIQPPSKGEAEKDLTGQGQINGGIPENSLGDTRLPKKVMAATLF